MVVDQKLARKYRLVAARINAERDAFARQGAIVATWRFYDGRRLGPYHLLVWRAAGRQRSLYLGRSPELAQEVRRLLDQVQEPRRRMRACARMRQAVRAALRCHKARWAQDLAKVGLTLKGFEVRGWRRRHRLGTSLR